MDDAGVLSAPAATLERYPDRAAWLLARRRGVGASESACLLGRSRFGTALTVWAAKLGLGVDLEDTVDMRRGRQLEDGVARVLADESGFPLVHHGDWTIARSTRNPLLYCTLDREIRPPNFPAGVAELKTSQRGEDWPPADVSGWDTVFSPHDVPEAYYIQVQHQLLVTGAPYGILAALVYGHRFIWGRIEPDPDYARAIEQAVAVFWPHVEGNTAPTVTGGPGEDRVVRALYPVEAKGTLTTLGEEWVPVDARRQQLKEAIGTAETELDALDIRLKAAIGDAEVAMLPNGVAYTFKSSAYKGYTVAPGVKRTLRRKENH